ncbi:MAG TPA: hypothetical protein VFY44_08940 [Thermoleophilaceae bacterium]|nr:hypothetical protein [Thermoleophilaceae bacterium]
MAGPAFGSEGKSGKEAPSVTTQSAVNVTTTDAQLRAQVKTGGDDDARYRFEYGTTTGYGATTPWRELDKREASYLVTRAISGLSAGTTYNFRVVASDDDGERPAVYGANQSFTTAVTPSPTPLIPDPAPGPFSGAPPQLGRTVGLAPGKGKVIVRKPGARAGVPLTAGAVVPVGSVVDATGGSLALTSALPAGRTQTGSFGGAPFTVRQGRNGYVDLYLRSTSCKRARKGTAATTARRKRGKRLFGRDRGGRFRTHGRNSHATVRGTRWSVEDTCKGTITRVSEGAVVVRDFAKRKSVLVKAGKRYIARPRR